MPRYGQVALWPGADRRNLFSGRFRKYLKTAYLPLGGLHLFRHSAAKLRRDAIQGIEEVGLLLDHSSLAVTSVYLRRLKGQADKA